MQSNTVVETADLITVQNLKKYYPVTSGIIFQKTIGFVKAIDGVSFSIPEGQTYSLVG